jgi:glycosyltransferase involved in cell wall biosynthesis
MLTLTDFWFLCPRMTLLRSDGNNCSHVATAWECTTCLSRDTKAYRWSKAVLPEPMVRRLLTTIGRTPVLSRQRGLRGMIGDMDGRQQCVREAFRCANHRVTASTFVRERYYAAGFTEPIEVRPYGHEISWSATRTKATRSDVVRLGYIGQIDRHKGIHVLLDAVEQLPVAFQQRVEVQIWGDASRAPEYVTGLRAKAARLPHVRFCGTYPHEASGDVFGGFDVLVVPSLWYDFPLVVHEAFASGVPVVATRLGGMAESVTPEVDGLLFERGDVAGCAKILTRLLEEPTLLERLRRGIRAVRTMAQEAQDVEQRYRALMCAQRGVIS